MVEEEATRLTVEYKPLGLRPQVGKQPGPSRDVGVGSPGGRLPMPLVLDSRLIPAA